MAADGRRHAAPPVRDATVPRIPTPHFAVIVDDLVRCAGSARRVPARTFSRPRTCSVTGGRGFTRDPAGNRIELIANDHEVGRPRRGRGLLGREPRRRVRGGGPARRRVAGRDPQPAAARRRHADAHALLAGRRARAPVGRRASSPPAACARPRRPSTPPSSPQAHERYAAERDAAVPAGHDGPRPSAASAAPGEGVKCLHAHYAWFLAGGDDPVGRWVDEQLRGRRDERARGHRLRHELDPPARRRASDDRRFVTLERLMRITRLGQGVDATGAAGARGDRAHGRRAARVPGGDGRRSASSASASTATSAAATPPTARTSSTPPRRSSGVRPELLSGDEEGRLSFLGATADLDPADGPFLVVDIGGGSTEFVVGTTEPRRALSIDIGCVRLTEQELHHDPPLAEELSIALSLIETYLDDVDREVPAASRGAHDSSGWPGRSPPLRPSRSGLPSTTATASTTSSDPRRRRGRVPHAGHRVARRSPRQPRARGGRADVIVGGCCVLVAIFRHSGLDECLVSEGDILDGLALSMMERCA